MLGSLHSVSAISVIPSSFKELSLILSDKQNTLIDTVTFLVSNCVVSKNKQKHTPEMYLNI